MEKKKNKNKNASGEELDFSPLAKEALLKIIEKTQPIQYFKTEIFNELGYGLCFHGSKNLIVECDYSPIKDKNDKNFILKAALHLSDKVDDIYVINYYLPSIKTSKGYNIYGFVNIIGKGHRDETCFCIELKENSQKVNKYFKEIQSKNFISCTVELAKPKQKKESPLFPDFSIDNEKDEFTPINKIKSESQKKLVFEMPSLKKLKKMIKLI